MEDIVKEKFAELVSYNAPGGQLYVALKDYLKFISRCHEEGIPILGMEGLERRANRWYPRIDLIADYSALTKEDIQIFIEKSYLAAMDFYQHLPQQDNLHICFTFP